MIRDRLPDGFAQMLRYTIAGLTTNTVNYLTFLLLLWMQVPPVRAAVLCYALGVILSYLAQRYWTFKSQSSHGRDVPRFIAAYAVGLAVTVVSMILLLRVVSPAWAELFTIGITALAIYGCLLAFGFGRSDQA